MTEEDKQQIADMIECEGFDYGFRNYGDFYEINDPKFHQLRLAYLKAAEELESYVSLSCT